MAGGEGYAQRHLQQSDYFDQKRTVEGHWHGRGAELLGLSGKVTSEDFESPRQGLDPSTGEFLRQRQGSDRISADGTEQSKARSLYDMTFSAPKSVSVMWPALTKRLRALTTQFVKIERNMVNWEPAAISIRAFLFSGQQRRSTTFPIIKRGSCFNSSEIRRWQTVTSRSKLFE